MTELGVGGVCDNFVFLAGYYITYNETGNGKKGKFGMDWDGMNGQGSMMIVQLWDGDAYVV
jgi:hypothetical protein